MRYDRVIGFLTVTRFYDEASGDYAEAQTIVYRMASVMDTKRETMLAIYGGIRQGSLTIHLQSHYTNAFDYIVIGTKRYRVDAERRLWTKQVFFVSEVH